MYDIVTEARIARALQSGPTGNPVTARKSSAWTPTAT
jgi:hypothetical protein